MRNARRINPLLVIMLGAVGLLAFGVVASNSGGSEASTPATTGLYHEQTGEELATPPSGGHSQPVPGSEDPASAGSMAVAGNAMILAADSMEVVVPTLASAGDSGLAQIAQHWEEDVQALRQRGAWMTVSATGAGMVHDPATARRVDLYNLLGNGIVMTEEGQAMTAHARDMISQAEQLRDDGTLPADVAERLITEGQAVVDAGQALEQDGERMQRAAEDLLRSIGR